MKHTHPLRRPLAGLLAACLFLSAILPLAAYAASEDIARGRQAYACHEESASLTPAGAVDGNSATRFAAGGGCAHDTWLILDLGDRYDLSEVRINWEAAHPSEYVLEISSDGSTYQELKTVEAASAGWVKTPVSGTGRFLRIREKARALSQYGFSIYDLEVSGTPAAESNTAAYVFVTVDPGVKFGKLTLSREGLVPVGTSITLTAEATAGGTLQALTANGKDVTAAMEGNRYTFTATESTTLSAAFTAAPADRYECEDAEVLDANRNPIAGTILSDADASGGKVAGGTGGKYFVFKNVTEANRIRIAYASTNTNSMNLYVRYPDETDFHAAGLIHFSTSNSWNMSSSYIASSVAVYIPQGSDIMLRPNVDCNLDCLWLATEGGAKPDTAPANTIPAAELSDKATEDMMATYGQSVTLKTGEHVTLTVPAGQDAYNVLGLAYCADAPATIDIARGGTSLGTIILDTTLRRTYATTGTRTGTYTSGDTLTLTCTSGMVAVDYVTVNYAAEAASVTVSTLPDRGDRLTVSLDGTWALGVQESDEIVTPPTVPEVDFINSIPVPGLYHSAAYDMGDYTGRLTWYQKTVVLQDQPTEQVLLYIEQAQYGRHIYVNGHYVDSYLYNYSHSYTDITEYLVRGENTIAIMLGSYSAQFNAKSTEYHVLYDGESTEDEPGITGSVSLIFNAAPEVQAVQTLPHLEEGSVEVQVTLLNRSDKAVTSDITVTVYELGVFENGVANQKEVKVGEITVSAAKVRAGTTETFLTTVIPLSDWSRDKCWTPDSPFLYRVEVKTTGDTYSDRFGMRTFDFDPVTKYARLNGDIFFIKGTNVAIERYYDDPLCGTTPWEEDWIRKLYSEFRAVGWTAFRTHLGNANEKWFDIADEMGMMIVDEYPQWGDQDGCVLETFLPEIYAWIDLRSNHPSLIIFDAQNEAAHDVFIDEIIRMGRAYDLQKRPWENGWRAPVGENDPVECHPYHIGVNGISGLGNMDNKTPIITLADIGWTSSDYPDYPYFINEHGEYWISREGAAMSATAGTWNAALPGATNEERLAYYAELMAAQIETYRAGRAYVGIFFFCGLASSFPTAQGVTCDVLSPDVSTAASLEIRPYTKELLANAYADLGIAVECYTEEVRRGERIRLPITLINDTGRAITDLPVTVKLMSGDTVLWAERVTMSVDAFSADAKGLSTENLSVTVPAFRDFCADQTTLTLTASYELDGETVYSQRKWTIKGGDVLSDEPLPTYDWLVEGESEIVPDTAPVEPTTDADTVPAVPSDTASDSLAEPSESNPSDKAKGCASALLAASLPLTAMATALCLQRRTHRRRRRRREGCRRVR